MTLGYPSSMGLWFTAVFYLFSSAPLCAAPAEEPVNVDELIKVVQSENKTSYLAAEALGHLGPKAKPAKNALVKALDSTDDRLRIASAFALAAIDLEDDETSKLIVKTLVAALSDPEPHVRREALRALSNVRRPNPRS